MAEASPDKLRFRPKARIIRTIGDQLISGPEAAVIELVKNAYDADARRVIVKFYPPLTRGHGRITVKDDGHGMTLGDIQDKWMEPATSSKLNSRRSPELNRVMMGSKGIGRFAAAKLGGRLGLNSITVREGKPQEVLIPEIDWSIFTGDTYLSDIAIDYLAQDTDQSTGTELEIRDLNEDWSEAKVKRLLLELRKLVSPLVDKAVEDRFQIFLDLSECTPATAGFDGRTILDNSEDAAGELDPLLRYEVRPVPLMTSCDYEVVGSFDTYGTFIGTFENRRAGSASESFTFDVPLHDEEDPCGLVGVRLFLFDREADAIRSNLRNAGLGDMTAAKARQILDSITGVAIYREGFRVRPYGDADNDWLTLDKERINDPSIRIGHNQVAGYITVAGPEVSHLEERSSREGFEANGAFRRLTRLIEQLLRREVEPRRYQFREKAGLSRGRSTTFEQIRKLTDLSSVRSFTVSLAPDERVKAEAAIDRQAHLISDRIADLEERQRKLEAASSLGAIISEIVHEGMQPAAYVATTTNRLKRFFPDMLGIRGPRFDAAKAEFEVKLPHLADAGVKLVDLFNNLQPLTAGRRSQATPFNVINVLMGAKALFDQSDVPIEIENPDMVTDVFGHASDLSTALVNLIKNSIHWLQDSRTVDPKIVLRVQSKPSEAIIQVEDNGPGIRKEFMTSIFDVGFSLRSGGTGLGLNIASEALARSAATLHFDPEFEDGTRFVIGFPREGAKG